ncbi:MAG: ABC transporter substrate-binding protein, partial [Proteobacteria bacterium]|nr:ABC transporter substrate-binding protein [Pseudomonadota bacterium]
EVDGHDFFAVYDAAREAVERARAGDGPSLLHVKLDRHYGHFEGDAMAYRAEGEVEALRRDRDCLRAFRTRVTETGLLEPEQLDAIEREVAVLIDAAVAGAASAAAPASEDLLTDVYASY